MKIQFFKWQFIYLCLKQSFFQLLLKSVIIPEMSGTSRGSNPNLYHNNSSVLTKCTKLPGTWRMRNLCQLYRLSFQWRNDKKWFVKNALGRSSRCHLYHDDQEKTIGDIKKKFVAFNCQLKKLCREILFWFISLLVTGYLLFKHFQYEIRKKIEIFLSFRNFSNI